MEVSKDYPIKSKEKFKSTHDLPFNIGQFPYDPEVVAFAVGTCHGIYQVYRPGSGQANVFGIIAIKNTLPGNGHLEDVFEWFYHSCKLHKYDMAFMEIWNKRFMQHLVKRGFKLWENRFAEDCMKRSWRKI